MPRRSPNDPIPESKKELEQKIKELEGQVQKWKDCSCKSVDWEYVDKLEKALAEKDKEIMNFRRLTAEQHNQIVDLKKRIQELEKENKELKWINGETLEKIRKVGKEQAIQSERDKIPFFLDKQAKKGLLTPQKADELKKAFKETV